jgi:hypothetical protein
MKCVMLVLNKVQVSSLYWGLWSKCVVTNIEAECRCSLDAALKTEMIPVDGRSIGTVCTGFWCHISSIRGAYILLPFFKIVWCRNLI